MWWVLYAIDYCTNDNIGDDTINDDYLSVTLSLMANSVSTRSCDDSLSITSTSLCPPGQLDVSTIRTSVDRDDDVGGDEDLNEVDSKKVIAKALEPTDSSEKKGQRN